MQWQPLPVDDDRSSIEEKLRTMAPSNPTVLIENRLISGMGKVHWIQFVNRGFFDPQGDLVEIQSVGRDITERILAEEKLLQKEAQIRSISNNLAFGMIYQVLRMKDGTRKFTYLSDAVRRLYGISPQEAMGNPLRIYSRVHPEDQARLMEEEEKANRTLSVFKSEVRMIDPAGKMRWSYFVSSPQRVEEGVTCWDGIEFDITERKLAEEDLISAHQKIPDLLESISDSFFALDDDLVVTYFNPAAERMLGRKAEEVLGLPLFDAFPEAKGSVFEVQYRAAIKEKRFRSFEVYFDIPPIGTGTMSGFIPRKMGFPFISRSPRNGKRPRKKSDVLTTNWNSGSGNALPNWKPPTRN